MIEQIKCPTCSREWGKDTDQAAAITVYDECIGCCLAHQQQVDPFRLQAQIMIDKPPFVTAAVEERMFLVRVCSSKNIKGLADHIGNRIWSLDKVTDVVVVEQE
jgi:hypothetical protein